MDEKYIESCYEQYRVGLYRFALSILKCPSMAEDALHEAFVRMMTKRGPAAGKEQAWLYRVVRNICYDMLRQRSYATGEVEKLASNDFAYMELIAPLSREEQELVSLRIIGRLSHKEIGSILGITPGSAQKRYDRAIQKLRREEQL